MLKSGELTPQMLMDMTSEQRVETFKNIFGMENAKEINYKFEQKLILKDQQKGIITWAKNIANINKKMRADIISKVEKMDTVLTPETEKEFYSDLVERKLGVAVTMDEAKNISTLSKRITEARTKTTEESDPESKEVKDLSKAIVEFQDYYNKIKLESKQKGWEWALPKNWLKGVSEMFGIQKSLKASLDFSVLLRQGIKTLYAYPDIWLKNSAKSFVDFYKTVTNKEDMDYAVRLDILSRKNYRNGLYAKQKLAVGAVEEAYPSSLPERIPILGRIFKGSELAFSLWAKRTRADIFDRLVDLAEKNGQSIEGLGEFVNSLTGRGNIGKLENAGSFLNNLFFAPRFLKANIDAATLGATDLKGKSAFVRKQMAKAYLKYAGFTFAILGLIAAFQDPDDKIVETDPTSSDFGKIKIGNTRFDISGGVISLYTLMARLLLKKSKSSVTGITREIGTGEQGSQSFGDLMLNFFEGKMSPFTKTLVDIYRGYDFSGKKVDKDYLIKAFLLPIPVENAIENIDKESRPIYLAGLIADALGVGTTTYVAEEDWSAKNTKEMETLKKTVGEKQFKRMNERFNKEYSKFLEKTKKSASYKRMSDEEKIKFISKNKKRIKDEITR